VVLAHRRVEGMNFIPGGYSYPEWGAANPGDKNQITGRTNEFASSSNPHVTRSSAGGQGTGPSSMSVDLRMAPQAEVIQHVSPVGQPQVTPARGVGGPPSGDPQGQTLMEHDGQETNSVSTPSRETQRSPSPNFMEEPSSSAQILMSSGQSYETLTAVMEGLHQMEALTLQQGTGSADVSREHTPIHAEARPATTPPWATQSKKPTSRPASAWRVPREKKEGSTRRKKRESPVRTTEDAEIPHPIVLTNRKGLCHRYRLAGISVPLLWRPEVRSRMNHFPPT
jgi:hypothetical protein